MSKTLEVVCDWRGCRTKFTVRAVDRARGWGRFCSKSCKAKHQSGKSNREIWQMSRGGYDWTEGGEKNVESSP